MPFNCKTPSDTEANQPECSADPNATSNIEKQVLPEATQTKKSVYAGLGWLDRLLALWIFLAIVVGILLGNFVNGVEEALKRGKFVNVSVPIGKSGVSPRNCAIAKNGSGRSSGYDVPNSVQGQI